MRPRIWAILGCAVGAFPLLGGIARAQTCHKPRVLIVLDRSSSMVTGYSGASTKWDVATGSLSSVLAAAEKSIDFGLMVFPEPNACAPGKVKVPVGARQSAAILAALAAPPPTTGNWTPMAQSLEAAGQEPQLNDPGYESHVLLITDGWQWCSPYDAATRFAPVNAVATLLGAQITTWVVGFGDGVDALALNKMAAVAQTSASPTCNAASDDPHATDNCYYQASDPGQLLAALESIAAQIRKQELCDGEDNDCDGLVDDGLGEGAPCAEQRGVCAGAHAACGGQPGWSCSASVLAAHAQALGKTYEAVETLCDGADNDCDGRTDEDCACLDGETHACGHSVGACALGVQVCLGGRWGSCTGGVAPTAEICDGEDNDCDGQTDEGLQRRCDTACGEGTEQCSAGAWGGCTAPAPAAEVCDGEDNDCDGLVDGPLCAAELPSCPPGECKPGAPASETDAAGPKGGCAMLPGAAATPGMACFAALLAAAATRRRRRRRCRGAARGRAQAGDCARLVR